MNARNDYDEEWLNEPDIDEPSDYGDDDECFDVDGW